MKKTFLFTLALAGLLQAFGQDTIHYGNPWYMFTGNYPDEFYPESIGGASHFYCNRVVQEYVAPPGEGSLIYGVAVTLYDSIPLADTMPYTVGIFRKVRYLTFYHGPDYTIRNAQFAQLDSAGLDATIKSCRFRYVRNSNDEGIAFCYEFYFNRPVRVSDTFYVGINTIRDLPVYPNPGWGGMSYGRDATCAQTWWMGDHCDSLTNIGDGIRDGGFAWGGVFPIVKYRCPAPKEGMPGAAGDDWVELLFDDDGEDHLYEITYARMEDMVDTNAGIRTTQPGNSLVASDLEPGRQYWYRVRRSCTLVTDSTTIVSWSPWSRGFLLPPHTLGVSQAEAAPDLEVRPNPASTVAEVTVEGGEACSVELVDMHGRTVMQRRAEGGSVVLDLAGLHPAVYTLRALTARGCATRRLVVAR